MVRKVMLLIIHSETDTVLFEILALTIIGEMISMFSGNTFVRYEYWILLAYSWVITK